MSLFGLVATIFVSILLVSSANVHISIIKFLDPGKIAVALLLFGLKPELQEVGCSLPPRYYFSVYQKFLPFQC